MARLAAQTRWSLAQPKISDQLPLPPADRTAPGGLVSDVEHRRGPHPVRSKLIPIRGGERTTNRAFRRREMKPTVKDSRSWPRGGGTDGPAVPAAG
jgi:hypothetical protein